MFLSPKNLRNRRPIESFFSLEEVWKWKKIMNTKPQIIIITNFENNLHLIIIWLVKLHITQCTDCMIRHRFFGGVRWIYISHLCEWRFNNLLRAKNQDQLDAVIKPRLNIEQQKVLYITEYSILFSFFVFCLFFVLIFCFSLFYFVLLFFF